MTTMRFEHLDENEWHESLWRSRARHENFLERRRTRRANIVAFIAFAATMAVLAGGLLHG